ncbi:MAG: 16S rRNA (uracil(1498)-N(3))-methyltransferase [Candidatus Omnitrophica bacterium]|nr:16S rRNA (uracil(1498)-N(3))-methyltransferase [Candidatus Omnitrophota bacterium]
MKTHGRRLRRFFSDSQLSRSGDIIFLNQSETHHLRHALRLQRGDRCLVVDGEGRQGEAVILDLDDQKTTLKVEKIAWEGMPSLVIRAIVALPQKGKMDFLVEKAQEVGLDGFWPMVTERTEVRFPDSKVGKVMERWERITQEAAKQSGAVNRMEILAPQSFSQAVERAQKDSRVIVFHPSKEAVLLKDWLTGFDADFRSKKGPGALSFLLGPEGGFSAQEMGIVRERQCEQVSLGKTILKVDTAFLAASGILRLWFP